MKAPAHPTRRSIRLGWLAAAALCVVIGAPAPSAHATARGAKGGHVVMAAKKTAKGGKGAKPADKAPERPADVGPQKSDPRSAEAAPAAAEGPADAGARRGMSRIEFDDRLVQGQTNKANAIYLFERRESALRSLLKKRTDFHEEIDETLD